MTPVTITLAHGASALTATTGPDGIASTRRGAADWRRLVGTNPVGEWQLTLDASADSLFLNGALKDVLVIISWTGQAAAWPT
jgi:hypothetical protein